MCIRSNTDIFICPCRCKVARRVKQRLCCSVLYLLLVESMLAWTHSQLVFHFEVLQTHGTRLLRERHTGQSEDRDEIIMHNFLPFSFILYNFLQTSVYWHMEITSLPQEDSTFLDLHYKPPEVTKENMFQRDSLLSRPKWCFGMNVKLYLFVYRPLIIVLV